MLEAPARAPPGPPPPGPPPPGPPPRHMVVLCGLIGSGKSTFAQAAIEAWPGTWTRCNQDELGLRRHVEALARAELAAGHSVIIDRTNADERQRADWLLLARDLRASMALTTTLLVFDVPASVCRARLLQRRDHPTIATPEQALRVLALFGRSYVRPAATRPEGFDRMVVLSEMPPLWTPAHLQDVWMRIERAPRLARAGDVVYADQPRRRPGRAPYRARGRRSRGARPPPAAHGPRPPSAGPPEAAPAAARAPSPPSPRRHVG
ncbi:Hypothetical protein MSYG_3243 [Malassezia sympodialis ATCC 42132]|uniref:Uncharacterized protein n=1 Tax=Malassezia sympodialis (strain ATCC 42132) TaxID=1230383 RepID=A0A1M8A8T6_MALS4|nr:Hypothetical protein MSYG_3243 [Malassezia sympodialis ATCC 42132]